MSEYVYPGALTTADGCYVERESDKLVAEALASGRFVHLAEPRQQGKTSLINRLGTRPELTFRFIVNVRASAFKGKTPDEWYRLIGGEILRKLGQLQRRSQIDFGGEGLPPAPKDANGWDAFLQVLAEQARQYLVIAIDEIDVVKFPGSDQFYSAIKGVRDLNDSKMAFLLSGCFHPSSLIDDPRVSPFNAANHEELPDLTANEVLNLVRMGLPGSQVEALAERINYWTDGHPAITQCICTRLKRDAVVADVDTEAENFIERDVNNLPHIKDRLKEKDLRLALADILAGQRHFLHEYDYETLDSRLRLAGLIKRHRATKHLVIRNRIYAEVFKPEDARPHVFLSYRHGNGGSAYLLRDKLIGRNVRTYFDDTSLQPGDPYPETLLEAIRSAPCFVLLLTQGDVTACQNTGDWLCREIKQALDVGAKIIPVVVRPCSSPRRADLPTEIGDVCDRQTIKCTYGEFDQVAEQIRHQCGGC